MVMHQVKAYDKVRLITRLFSIALFASTCTIAHCDRSARKRAPTETSAGKNADGEGESGNGKAVARASSDVPV
jgi:hypothetical protein